MFEQSMVLPPRGLRKASSLAMSLVLQVVLLTVALLVPLLVTDRLPGAQLSALFVLPPLPRVAAAPAREPEVSARPARRAPPVATNQFVAPSVIPKEVARIVDDFALSDSLKSLSTLQIAGSPAGSGPGIAGITGLEQFGAIPTAAPPPPKPQPVSAPKAVERIALGGQVVEAKAIFKPAPKYPPLARQARIQGPVELNAIIGADGRIKELQVKSGHPLLVREAVAAVSQWRYSPTFLNGDPVEVITQITVSFTLR